jgi:hypothetical protein
MLILVQSACGKAGGSGITSATPSPTKGETYKVGDVVQVQDHTITLNSVLFYNNGLQASLIANFVIENKGSEALYVNSDLFGAADNTNGSPLEKEPGCGFMGEILPGHILQGSLCWNGVPPDSIRIYCDAKLYRSANDAPFSDNDDMVFWEFNILSATPASTKVETYKVGDVIQIEDHVTITLNSVDASSDGLQATFTIENKGSKNFFTTPGFVTVLSPQGNPYLLGRVRGKVCGSAFEGTISPGHSQYGMFCWSWNDIRVWSFRFEYYYPVPGSGNPVDVIWVIDNPIPGAGGF